jgi:hypothetical protein
MHASPRASDPTATDHNWSTMDHDRPGRPRLDALLILAAGAGVAVAVWIFACAGLWRWLS